MILTDGSEQSQPKQRQLDLFRDYGQHARQTRRDALNASRRPRLEAAIDFLRQCRRHGAIRHELADAVCGGRIQSVGDLALALLKDGTAVETGEKRKTPSGKWASVLVHADFAGSDAEVGS